MPGPLLLAKKRIERLPTPVAACPDANTFLLTEAETGHSYLVDTGASRSLFPKNQVHRNMPKSTFVMRAANGSQIDTYGTIELPISSGQSRYTWKFLVADVFMPILGADFLAFYNLAVDVRQRRLIDASIIAAATKDNYEHLQQEFPSVFSTSLARRPTQHPTHGIQHHIKTSGPPVFAKFRRLSPEKLAAAKQCFKELEDMGICQKASSPWSSPLHIVTKKDGSLRPCGDYRRLNNQTEADHYPLPNINDITSYLHGAQVFSKLDLVKGYYQVPMAPEDVPKTAITTPFGTFTFNYSCFGLRNAGATFQRLMDGILGDLPFCVVYIDDILIFSPSQEEHLQHIREVLRRLQENGLILHPGKCIFGQTNIEFLGHTISSDGVTPLPAKVEAIRRFPTPTTIKALQEFIGMITYYHRFLPNIAKILAPLHNALKGKPKKLSWPPEADAAFKQAKDALADAAMLTYPAPNAQLQLVTDASDTATGAVLEQLTSRGPAPIAFFSRKLSPTEARYSTFDRELLAVHLATRHFRHLLETRPFKIHTDHLPLIHALNKRSDPYSKRQQRHLSAITEFNCEVLHVPGKKNVVADALSRNCIGLIHGGLNLSELAVEQKDLEGHVPHPDSSLKWETVQFSDGIKILCDVSTGRPRPWIPEKFRRQVFDAVHGLAHPSRRSTARLMKEKFIWDSISKDAKNWTRACISCQRAKIHRHTESGIGSFPQPNRRFGHIHVDIVGPLPPSQSFKYLFTIIDRSTRWPEAVPMVDASTESCVTALINHWIARFGVPDLITSDRGTVFTSNLWASIANKLGLQTQTTTSYNPEANGMVERLHRTLKAALMARCNSPRWSFELPWVLLGLRTTPKEGDDITAAEKVYGDSLTVPADFFPSGGDPNIQDLRSTVAKFIPCRQTYRDTRKSYTPPDLHTTSHVFVRVDAARPPLTPPYTGPYKVLQRKQKAFQLKIRNSTDWVSIDRLKPAYLLKEDQPPIQFSRAGRPLVRGRLS